MFADRTSAKSLKASQPRLWFDSTAHVLVSALRRLGLAHMGLAEASCDTIRLKLLEFGAQVDVGVRRVKIALCSARPSETERRLAFPRPRAARAPPRWFARLRAGECSLPLGPTHAFTVAALFAAAPRVPRWPASV